jgi:hypothetical protein
VLQSPTVQVGATCLFFSWFLGLCLLSLPNEPVNASPGGLEQARVPCDSLPECAIGVCPAKTAAAATPDAQFIILSM